MKDTHTFVLCHYLQLDDYFRCFVAEQNMNVFRNTVRVYRKALGHEVPGGMLVGHEAGREFEYEDLDISVNRATSELLANPRYWFRCNVNGLIFVMKASANPNKIKRHVVLFGRVIKNFLKAYETYEPLDYV